MPRLLPGGEAVAKRLMRGFAQANKNVGYRSTAVAALRQTLIRHLLCKCHLLLKGEGIAGADIYERLAKGVKHGD